MYSQFESKTNESCYSENVNSKSLSVKVSGQSRFDGLSKEKFGLVGWVWSVTTYNEKKLHLTQDKQGTSKI